MSVTIKEIAELANVSRGTVDKVLNGRPGVKTETKNTILKIAEELNYKPNYLGKALVQHKEKTKIGIILTPEYNPYIQEIIRGIHDAQEEYSPFGIEVTIKMLGTLEPAEQISILNIFENEQYSGIAVFPINDDQVIRKINYLSEKGMVVVTFNSQIPAIEDICFVGQDHYKGGQAVAGLFNKILPEGGKIAVIMSSHNLSCHQDRLRGFSDKLAAYFPKLKIVEVQENQDRKDEAFRITLETLNNYPDLNAIYITSGGVAGVGHALEIAGRVSRVKVICHDIIPDSIELLKKGIIDFAIGQDPELQGYLLVKTLFDFLIKKTKPKQKILDVPIDIVTEDTI